MEDVLQENIDNSQKDIEALAETKKENLQYTNKSAYIKEKVFEFKTLWWEKFKTLMSSEDREDYKLAFSEYNKLQAKVLPTEISGVDGENLLPTSLIITLNQDATNTGSKTDPETSAGVDETGGQSN